MAASAALVASVALVVEVVAVDMLVVVAERAEVDNCYFVQIHLDSMGSFLVVPLQEMHSLVGRVALMLELMVLILANSEMKHKQTKMVRESAMMPRCE